MSYCHAARHASYSEGRTRVAGEVAFVQSHDFRLGHLDQARAIFPRRGRRFAPNERDRQLTIHALTNDRADDLVRRVQDEIVPFASCLWILRLAVSMA